MRLPEISVKRPVTVLMIILIIVVLGIISFTRLGLDMMPDITYPVLLVAVSYPGVSSEDVENMVTKPIEEIVATVKNVKKINSFSQEGLAGILVEFEWGANLDLSAQDIRDRIDLIRDFLPEDISKPVVHKFDPSMIPIMVYGVSSVLRSSATAKDEGERDLLSLRSLTKDMFKDRLEQVDGVASVMLFGGFEREILLEIDKQRLEAYHLTLDEVMAKLRAENLNLPGGHIEDRYREYLLRTTGEFTSLKEMENLPITLREGVPIYLKDIGRVEDTYKELRALSRTNRKDAVMLIVSKESGANTVIVSNRAKKELEKIKNILPGDIQIYTVFDISRMINQIVNVTSSNALVGGILATAVLFLFLASWRPTLTIGLSIPLSILATFIPLYFLGYTLNFITLIGLALGVGMLVDNSIVVIENIFRHLKEGKDRINASIIGASEVGMAITASTLTTVVVFLPLIFAKGITGKLFWGLALTVTANLMASLFVALTIVPMVTSKILRADLAKGRLSWETRITEPMRNFYRKVLTWVLKNRFKVLGATVTVFIISIILAYFSGREFFPKVDNNMVLMMVRMPVGTTLEETDRITKRIEDVVLEEKGVLTVLSQVGLSEYGKSDAVYGTGPTGVHEAEIFIRLKDKLEREKSSDEVINTFRKKIPELEGVKFEFMDMGTAIMTGGGRSNKPIEIKLFGKDIETLDKIAERIIEEIRQIKGIYDVDTTLVRGKPELLLRVDREKAARFGLTVGQVASTVQTAFQGKVATRFHSGGEEIDVRIRLQAKDRKTFKDIENLSIPTLSGVTIPLGEVAKFTFTFGPIRLSRENQKRTISVTANLSGRDLGGAIRDIKSKLGRAITLPEGYFVEYAGEAEQMYETFRDLGLIFLLALLLVYMVMAAEFESLIHPLVIMFTVPFAIIGVVFSVILAGKRISLPMGMGVTILSGVIVNNGIVLIDYINQLRHRGKEKEVITSIEAIIEAGATRLRPVLMTSITTILGLIPMVYSRGEGSEVRSVVAVTLIGGLTIGTILTLLVLPIVYIIFDQWAVKITERIRIILHGKPRTF
jgi:HAE1 family hydrophobic/amphiphilic exporter-1